LPVATRTPPDLFFFHNRCSIEFWYIKHLEFANTRVANDDFDITFGDWTDIHWSSPQIWDNEHQSFIRQVKPVAVHSHNDYTRRIPLWEALGSGCISVEADVTFHKSDLLVGHTRRSLKRENSLKAMYLEPLQRLFDIRNANVSEEASWRGVFDAVSQQTLVLLIDFKSASQQTLAELDHQLESLRAKDYLTYWNGTDRILRPLTIVASGKVEFDGILALHPLHRDIFFDAPLAFLHDPNDIFSADSPIYTYNISNSYYASSELKNGIIMRADRDDTSLASQDASSSQLDQAKSRGLVSRYWGEKWSEYHTSEAVMWRFLINAKIGILNMDDMGAVRDRSQGMGGLTIQE